MRANLFSAAIIGITIVFPLVLHAQNMDGAEMIEEEPVMQENTSDLGDDSFDEFFEDTDGTTQEQTDTSMTEQETPEYSPAEDVPNDFDQTDTQEADTDQDLPTPTPPQNLTYLDYFYYVRARYDGNIPTGVVTDYNGDGKTDEQDKEIVLQALNPDYDPATVTPSPIAEPNDTGDAENEDEGF